MRDRLAASLGEVLYSDLRAHAARDAIIVVADGLDLVDVGEAVARDDVKMVEWLIQTQGIRKPSAGELSRWEADPEATFESLVVQPFVLMRPVRRIDPNAN